LVVERRRLTFRLRKGVKWARRPSLHRQ
jgi:hypothetical protein